MPKFVLTPELVDALKNDSQRAFLTIYQGYRDPIYIHAYNILKNEGEAEDVTIKTFYALWMNRDGFEVPDHVRNYLFLVAKNGCLNILKGIRRREDIYEQYHQTTIGETVMPALFRENERGYADLLGSVWQAIRNLPEKTRDIFVLRYYSGKSADEVAAIMGVSIKTVYNQSRQATKSLRNRLRPGEL